MASVLGLRAGGLYIARELAEHMGGGIGFESRENAGSTVWIEFPLAA